APSVVPCNQGPWTSGFETPTATDETVGSSRWDSSRRSGRTAGDCYWGRSRGGPNSLWFGTLRGWFAVSQPTGRRFDSGRAHRPSPGDRPSRDALCARRGRASRSLRVGLALELLQPVIEASKGGGHVHLHPGLLVEQPERLLCVLRGQVEQVQVGVELRQ